MDQVVISGLSGGGGGILGALAGFFGLKTKIKNIEKRVDKMADSVRYEDTCIEISKAIREQLQDIKDMQKEIRDDIKGLPKK